jgi:hypothetical protein
MQVIFTATVWSKPSRWRLIRATGFSEEKSECSAEVVSCDAAIAA